MCVLSVSSNKRSFSHWWLWIAERLSVTEFMTLYLLTVINTDNVKIEKETVSGRWRNLKFGHFYNIKNQKCIPYLSLFIRRLILMWFGVFQQLMPWRVHLRTTKPWSTNISQILTIIERMNIILNRNLPTSLRQTCFNLTQMGVTANCKAFRISWELI